MRRDELHRALVAELLEIFLDRGFRILGAQGESSYPEPRELPNDGYGDQEAKIPDVYAYDKTSKRYIIGMAKTGDGDFETEHALTEYNVFLDQFDQTTGQQAMLYVIVPNNKVAEFNTLITHYIHREYWKSIIVVCSKE